MTTTLWDYPSQHYEGPGGSLQGDPNYAGATPGWVVWQVLHRFSREGDTVVDPMCGSGTTLDVCRDLGRRGVGFDLVPRREDIRQGDARRIDMPDASAQVVFIDPPYSTHIDYSDDPACIGRLDAGGRSDGRAYYRAMREVIGECARVVKPGGVVALYVSDSYRKVQGPRGDGEFMAIGFRLFELMREAGLEAIDIVSVVRHNAKLAKPNWRRTADAQGFMLRGFNYLFLMRKPRQPRRKSVR